MSDTVVRTKPDGTVRTREKMPDGVVRTEVRPAGVNHHPLDLSDEEGPTAAAPAQEEEPKTMLRIKSTSLANKERARDTRTEELDALCITMDQAHEELTAMEEGDGDDLQKLKLLVRYKESETRREALQQEIMQFNTDIDVLSEQCAHIEEEAILSKLAEKRAILKSRRIRMKDSGRLGKVKKTTFNFGNLFRSKARAPTSGTASVSSAGGAGWFGGTRAAGAVKINCNGTIALLDSIGDKTTLGQLRTEIARVFRLEVPFGIIPTCADAVEFDADATVIKHGVSSLVASAFCTAPDESLIFADFFDTGCGTEVIFHHIYEMAVNAIATDSAPEEPPKKVEIDDAAAEQIKQLQEAVNDLKLQNHGLGQ